MGPIFKSFVAGAAVIVASASAASAQDYTWTINNAEFGPFAVNDGSVPSGFDGAALTGSFTLTKVGLSYVMTSYNLETGFGNFSNINGAIYDDLSGGTTFSNDGVPMTASLSFTDWEGSYQLDLFWTGNALLNAMNANNNGAVLFLQGLTDLGGGAYGGTVESDYTENNMLRYLNCGDVECEVSPTMTLSISNMPETPVPEPASMALLGAGLLGLAAARRRKAAR